MTSHLSLTLLSLVTTTTSSSSSCHVTKTVGGLQLIFSHEDSEATAEAGCEDSCVYTELNNCHSYYCLQNKQSSVTSCCHKLMRKYCHPGHSCWPTQQQLVNFSNSINGNQLSCLGLPKFVSREDASSHQITCLPYTGLRPHQPRCNVLSEGLSLSHHRSQPRPSCDPNPFVSGAYYEKGSGDQISCMTPYQFLNNRNYKKQWMAALIVTAETSEDISKAVTFARYHSLGVSVFGTGHDMQDRNAGPGSNTLLIRTTCFTEWSVSNDTITSGDVTQTWSEGHATVGAGLTFGTNFWWNITNAEGTHALAARANKETVGGSCHSVGVVGWTLGGGRGLTSPMYGLGVDQLLHVDLVTADGTVTSANFTYNKELFFALRGGGGGFCVITSLKIKLHNPSCRDSEGKYTMTGCYTKNRLVWRGPYTNSTKAYVKQILLAYGQWSVENRQSSYSGLSLRYKSSPNNEYIVTLKAGHFGHAYVDNLRRAFVSFTKDLVINETLTTSKYWCELFPDKNNTDNCTFHRTKLLRFEQSIRFVVKREVMLDPSSSGLIERLLTTWQPLCDLYPHSPCVSAYQIHGVLPDIDPHTGRHRHEVPGSALSHDFRQSSFQMNNIDIGSVRGLTFVQRSDWMREVLGPLLYTYSNASYFNEAEYTLDRGHWQRRFWNREDLCRLKATKRKYDRSGLFDCRHCVDSHVE